MLLFLSLSFFCSSNTSLSLASESLHLQFSHTGCSSTAPYVADSPSRSGTIPIVMRCCPPHSRSSHQLLSFLILVTCLTSSLEERFIGARVFLSFHCCRSPAHTLGCSEERERQRKEERKERKEGRETERRREGGEKEGRNPLLTHITLPGGPAQLKPTVLMMDGDIPLLAPLQGVPPPLILFILSGKPRKGF